MEIASGESLLEKKYCDFALFFLTAKLEILLKISCKNLYFMNFLKSVSLFIARLHPYTHAGMRKSRTA